MKVRMKKTVDGAPEGTLVKTFVEGTEHDLTHTQRSRDLAQVFVREGWAEEVGAAPVSPLKAIADDLRAGTFQGATPVEPPAEVATAPASPKAEKRKGK